MRALAGKTGIGILLALAVALLAQLAGSEPVRQKILDELDIQDGEAITTIRISLTSPVRYIRHFPYTSGDELRIRVGLFDVSSDNRESIFRRETLVPHDNIELPLNEIVYENDLENEPYLTLFFSHPVEFGVQQGTDSRSIVVYIKKPAAGAAAQPLPDPDK